MAWRLRSAPLTPFSECDTDLDTNLTLILTVTGAECD